MITILLLHALHRAFLVAYHSLPHLAHHNAGLKAHVDLKDLVDHRALRDHAASLANKGLAVIVALKGLADLAVNVVLQGLVDHAGLVVHADLQDLAVNAVLKDLVAHVALADLKALADLAANVVNADLAVLEDLAVNVAPLDNADLWAFQEQLDQLVLKAQKVLQVQRELLEDKDLQELLV